MTFTIGFWHPFGPHGGETAEAILARKQREIDAHGWTLWSFQRRRMLDAWADAIRRAAPAAVYVCCSASRGAVDPPHAPTPCTAYRLVGDADWLPMPAAIQTPHPFAPSRAEASAFVVRRIVAHPFAAATAIEWLHRDGGWRPTPLPTRGEFLIRPGAGGPLRPHRAVLELCPPYLAVVRR